MTHFPASTEQNATEPINVRDFGAVALAGVDDSPAFTRALAEAVRRGPGAVLHIPAGVYQLQTPMDGGMIAIHNADGLTVQGEDGTLLISNQPAVNMVHIVDSRNVTVRNLTMDRHPFVFTQGRIGALDAAARTVDVDIDPGYDEPDAPYLAPLRSLLVWTDPQAPTWDHSRPWPAIVGRERLAPMRWRLRLSEAPRADYLAKRFLIWDNMYKGWGVVATRSRDVLVEDIRYYARRGRRRHGRLELPRRRHVPPLHRRRPARLRPAAGRRRGQPAVQQPGDGDAGGVRHLPRGRRRREHGDDLLPGAGAGRPARPSGGNQGRGVRRRPVPGRRHAGPLGLVREDGAAPRRASPPSSLRGRTRSGSRSTGTWKSSTRSGRPACPGARTGTGRGGSSSTTALTGSPASRRRGGSWSATAGSRICAPATSC